REAGRPAPGPDVDAHGLALDADIARQPSEPAQRARPDDQAEDDHKGTDADDQPAELRPRHSQLGWRLVFPECPEHRLDFHLNPLQRDGVRYPAGPALGTNLIEQRRELARA